MAEPICQTKEENKKTTSCQYNFGPVLQFQMRPFECFLTVKLLGFDAIVTTQ